MDNPININLPDIAINKGSLWIVLLVFFTIYWLIAAILFFHWTKYGLGNKRIILAETTFVLVSVVLFLIPVVVLILY